MTLQSGEPRTLASTEEINSPPSVVSLLESTGAGHDGAPVDLPVRFRFACFGATFEAVTENRDGGAVLAIRGAIRHLPYSAENPAARERLHALLRAVAKPLAGKLVLTGKQKIEFRAEAALVAPVLTAQVLQQTTITLLRWRPLFDIVRDYA